MADGGGEGVDLGIPGLGPAVLVGRGGFGLVYRATQLGSGGVVAVKVLQDHLDESASARFQREASALGELRGHPNICTVYDAGVDPGGRPYLIMEFAPSTLAQRIADGGALPWQDAADLGVRLAGALEAAHQRGLLHRDVKPENVLRTAFDEWRLADFGLVRRADETASRFVTATVTHAAPELLEGAPASAASDVYALGSTLFVALTGRPAFAVGDQSHPVSIYRRIAEEAVPDIDGVPAAVADVVRTAMAKAPADRFPSAAAMGAALQQAQREAGAAETVLRAQVAAPSAEAVPDRTEPDVIVDARTPARAEDLTQTVLRGGREPRPQEGPGSEPTATKPDRRLIGVVVAAAAVVAVVVGALALRGGDGSGGPTATTDPSIITDEVALPNEWRMSEQTEEECTGANGPPCLDTTDFTFDMTTNCEPVRTGAGRSVGQDAGSACEVSFLGMEPVPLEWNGLYGSAEVEREDPLPPPAMEYGSECTGQPAYYSMEFWPKSEEVRDGRRVVTEVTGKLYAYFLTLPGVGRCGTSYTYSFVLQAEG
jgi:hypothetical protein